MNENETKGGIIPSQKSGGLTSQGKAKNTIEATDALTETQAEIGHVLECMNKLLVHKNKNYGDSALNPLGLFTKFVSEKNDAGLNSILVRLDDKMMRIKNAKELRLNDVMDVMGYLTLLMIAMGATEEDFKKQMD
jgi:hypothetical protein